MLFAHAHLQLRMPAGATLMIKPACPKMCHSDLPLFVELRRADEKLVGGRQEDGTGGRGLRGRLLQVVGVDGCHDDQHGALVVPGVVHADRLGGVLLHEGLLHRRGRRGGGCRLRLRGGRLRLTAAALHQQSAQQWI